MKTLLVTFAVFACGSAVAENAYLPVRQGAVSVFSYDFHIDQPGMKGMMNDAKGEMTAASKEIETKSGKQYLRVETTYKDLPYHTNALSSWRREENGAVYVGSEIAGKWSETLEMPAAPAVGMAWDYIEGQPAKHKITAIVSAVLPSGEKLSDCLEIEHAISEAAHKDGASKLYYCRGVGFAGSRTEQGSPMGTYVTEVRLKSYK